jgi:perosamine synthetase
MKKFFPVNEPKFQGNEALYLDQCIKSGEVAAGKFIGKFEREFAKHLNRNFAQTVSNGTAALEVALYAAGVRPGDEVIMPSFTIISCALAILRVGAIPVISDVSQATLNIEAVQIEQLITKKTRAIMVVHTYGHPCDMDPINDLANHYHLKIVEDTAEAHGGEYKGKLCGSLGDVSTFSFYANKHITTGEGGMVVTNSEEINSRAAFYKNLCFEPNDRFHHNELGYNFRLSNIQCAVGLAQLENFSSALEHKIKCGERYKKNLQHIPFFEMQEEAEWAKQVYWVYCIRILEDFPVNAKKVIELLRDEGVDTRPFFKGMHAQPALQNLGLFADMSCPVSDLAYKKGFYLPSGLNLSLDDIDQVCDIVESIFIKLAK